MCTDIKELDKVSSSRETRYNVYIDGDLFTICRKNNLRHSLTLAELKNRGNAHIKVVKEITTEVTYLLDDTRFMEENGIDW